MAGIENRQFKKKSLAPRVRKKIATCEKKTVRKKNSPNKVQALFFNFGFFLMMACITDNKPCSIISTSPSEVVREEGGERREEGGERREEGGRRR
jgi:hypothetical protein